MPPRYDLTLGSDKSSSLSRSERDAGTYDIIQAENNSNNNNSIVANGSTTLDSNKGEAKKRKLPVDRGYQFAKEYLMTERTYKKDLDILNTWFRNELSPEDIDNLQPLYQLIESMVQHHSVFLRDLEHRIILWEGRGENETNRIGDIMLKNMVVLPIYDEYVENINDILQNLNNLYHNDDNFQQIYREFEQQKVCYLPIMHLVLKPLHRLLHYQFLLEQFLDHYPEDHSDRTDCHGTLVMISRTTDSIKTNLDDLENFVLLCELQRDISGFDSLVRPNRRLVRQGCLLKHSKRGLQQRMFFLFSDILLYASKIPVNDTFKILGHVPVGSLITENSEHNTFVIFGGTRSITVSASTTAEKTLWLAELSKSVTEFKSKPHVQLSVGSLKNCSSSEEGLETCGLNLGAVATVKTQSTRSNSALNTCWQRNATISLQDYLVASENQLSGFLLRKFKNKSGWQKLWVVFTSFCLYFYKNCNDDYALANLPLLGFTVGPPGGQDAIEKEFVFKLSLKNHVYFFRAESEHSLNRWLHVLRTTTQTQDFRLNSSIH